MKVVIDGIEYVPKVSMPEKIEPAPSKEEKRARQMLAIKSPLPAKGEGWNWHVRYFNEGDEITWRNRIDEKVYTDTVTKVKRNHFGRISYVTKNHKLVLTEEVQEAQ